MISSESQLDDGAFDDLFLCVCRLDAAKGESPGAFSITELAQRIGARIEDLDAVAGSIYQTRLVAAGIDLTDDYTRDRWVGEERVAYRVHGAFPRLIRASIAPEIAQVSYSVALGGMAEFVVAPAVIEGAIRQERNG
jgi:hypothetical protein